MVVLEHHLAANLQTIHLFGSAIEGGLQAESDIDLLVTVSTPLSTETSQALMLELLTVSAPAGTDPQLRPLEVTVLAQAEILPWRYPARRELQFGEWLRAELQAGVFEPALLDHDLAILLQKARQHSICLKGVAANDLFEPIPPDDFTQALQDTTAQWNEAADWAGEERNIVLALARIWFSASTGKIAAKDSAATWALARLPQAQQAVMERARAAYLGQATDDLAQRSDEVAALVFYIKEKIRQVYADAAG
ncbi:Streptomycin 3''-adenylyltransferase [compost metagenome]